MTRPAIIIGLGGTGQHIVTFLKKELLEIGGGQLPKEVKLFAFDTASRVTPRGAVDPQKVFRLGNVVLEEDTEYINIGADLYDTAQRIKADQERVAAGEAAKLPHLGWFPAKELIERGLGRAALNTMQGAGAYRPLGRLSLFHHVYRVLGHLEQAMVNLQAEVRGTRTDLQTNAQNVRLLEIIVVGSLAGGTGAGTFIDMAWLARAQADKILRDKYALRGFFLLPTTFTAGGVGSDAVAVGQQGRGFAAWHELDRAMLSSGSGDEIVYNPADDNLHIRCDMPAYDITYLIDPLRVTLPIYPPPEEGIFPGVAHLLSFLVDEEAGRKYTENLINVLVDTRGDMPVGVYHSAIGGYTLKVPVYYTQAKFSHKLAQEVLKVLLAPEENEKGRVIRISQLANKEEEEGKAGLRAAVGFLTSDVQKDDVRTVPNTMLLQSIGQHRQKKARQNASLVKTVAQGGLRTTLLPYFNALNKITEYNPETDMVESRDFTGELQWAIWKECPPSREYGDTPETAWTRLTSDAVAKSVPAVRKRRYGIEVAASRGARLRGEFGAELEELKAAHLRRFEDLLRMQTLRDLNGRSTDASIARGGKLGYVRAFYKELIETFAYYRGFLDDVRQKRSEELKLAQTTRNAAARALKAYDQVKSKDCWVTFWDGNVHPDAHRAQRNWLQAEMRDIDRLRGDILLDVLDETVAEMQEYVEKTLAEVENWVVHLATGDATYEIESLYHRVKESLAGIETNHALDKRLGNPTFDTQKTLKGVSQILHEDEFTYTDQMLSNALEKIRWDAEIQDGKLELICGIELPGKDADSPSRFEAFRRGGDEPARYNMRLLLQLTEQPYQGIRKDNPLTAEIQHVYPDGKSLAQAMQGHAEPYYRLRNGQVPPAVRQTFLRVNDENNPAMQHYFDVEFRTQFLTANPQLGGRLDKVVSEDRYKLTLVRSDDLMPSESFDQWHACFNPYRSLFARKTPREIHIFSAEQNAAFFEREMPRRLKQNYRILRPEVVTLLEDRRRFQMFFRAFSHGFIQRRIGKYNGVQHRFWGYQLPGQEEPIYLTPPLVDTSPPSVFDVIMSYLRGKDKRTGFDEARGINWQELRNMLVRKEQELGVEKAVQVYQSQLEGDSPESIIKIVLDEGQSVQALSTNTYQEQAKVAHQKYRDLADVARIVFMLDIERLQQPTW